MTNNSTTSAVPAASYFLIGLAAGSALALLYTPFSGGEARARIKDGIQEGKEKVANEAEALRRKGEAIAKTANGLVDAGKKRLAEEHHRIDSALQAGKAAYTRA